MECIYNFVLLNIAPVDAQQISKVVTDVSVNMYKNNNNN